MSNPAVESPGALSSAARFDIVVINHQLIHLFLTNFHKFKNFDPSRDRVVVLDCSDSWEGQRAQVEQFCKERCWTLGREVVFQRRSNWGIDQGGRIDYLTSLHQGAARAPYVWQFQEHYLDNTSSFARYPDNIEVLGGQMKEDILPDGMEIDLDTCERAFSDPEVSVVYADRLGLRVFLHPDGREWFFADGGNLAFRTSTALTSFSPSQLDEYRLVFDASYRWAGFFEFEFGRCLTVGAWFDLATGRKFRNYAEVKAAEAADGKRYGTLVDPHFADRFSDWMDRYQGRIPRVRALPPPVRDVLLKTAFPAVGAFQRRVFFPLRSKLRARNIDSPQWMRKIW